MDKIKEAFNPIYNAFEQVKQCSEYMLKENVIDCQVTIVIGFNGRNFVTSTDWRLTTDNHKRIMPFFIHPQYPNFMEVIAGVNYTPDKNGRFEVRCDKPGKEKNAVIKMPDGKEHFFPAGKAVKIKIDSSEKFPATDCAVKLEETEDCRIFTVLPDETTDWGIMENGKICRYD